MDTRHDDPAAGGTPSEEGAHTTPPGPETPPDPPGAGPRVTGDQLRDVSRLRRPRDRRIGGVAAGLARHLDVDPLVLRIAFVVLVFFGGAGLLLYGALWLLLPEDGAPQAPLHLDDKSRGIAIVGVGVLAALLLLGDTWNLYWFPWPLALAGVAIWYFFFRDQPSAAAPNGEPQAAPYTGTYSEDYGQGFTPGAATPGTAAPAPQWAAPQWTPPPTPVTRPADPRKRGPRLFWFTCALATLAVGVLGVVDLAGASVVDSAYPALVLAIVAVVLVVGSVHGRAGGLILLGLVTAGATATTLTAEQWESDFWQVTPASASSVEDSYDIGAGELVLDLRDVDDLDGLDGHHVDVTGGVGRLEVILPSGLDARVTAEVGGPGNITLFDDVDRGGIGTSATAEVDQGGDRPQMTLDVELGVGQIEVRTR